LTSVSVQGTRSEFRRCEYLLKKVLVLADIIGVQLWVIKSRLVDMCWLGTRMICEAEVSDPHQARGRGKDDPFTVDSQHAQAIRTACEQLSPSSLAVLSRSSNAASVAIAQAAEVSVGVDHHLDGTGAQFMPLLRQFFCNGQ